MRQTTWQWQSKLAMKAHTFRTRVTTDVNGVSPRHKDQAVQKNGQLRDWLQCECDGTHDSAPFFAVLRQRLQEGGGKGERARRQKGNWREETEKRCDTCNACTKWSANITFSRAGSLQVWREYGFIPRSFSTFSRSLLASITDWRTFQGLCTFTSPYKAREATSSPSASAISAAPITPEPTCRAWKSHA